MGRLLTRLKPGENEMKNLSADSHIDVNIDLL
jgi:hypothetical protein